jgi:hypothetical protein
VGSSGASNADAGAGAEVGVNGGASPGGAANGGASAAGVGNGGSLGRAGSGGAGVAGSGDAPSEGGPVFIGSAQFHDSASGEDNANGHLSDATFDKPSGTAEGDFMLAFFGVDHQLTNVSTEELAAQGWTLLDQHADFGTDGQGAYLMYRFASASEPAKIVLTAINTNHYGLQGLLSVYRGVNTADPVNAYQPLLVKTGAEVAHVDTPTPAVTTTVAHCLVIAGLAPDTMVDSPVITAWPVGFDENQVSVTNPPFPFPYGWTSIYAAERHVAVAGKVAAASFGWDIGVSDGKKYFGSLAFTLALAP